MSAMSAVQALWRNPMSRVLVVSLLALACGQAVAAEVRQWSQWPARATMPAPAPAAPMGTGDLTLFPDRIAFSAATTAMDLTEEDFASRDPLSVSPCREPLNRAMGQPGTIFLAPYCFESYQLQPGLSIRSESGAAQALNLFAFGAQTVGLGVTVVGAMGPTATRLDFTGGPRAVAFDAYDWQAGSPLTFTVYGAGDQVIASFTRVPGKPVSPVFVGFTSPEPVRRVEVRSASGASQMVAGLAWGGTGPRLVAGAAADFGAVALGTSASTTVTVANDGDLPVQVPTLAAPSAPFGFGDDGCSGVLLVPGEDCTVQVDYHPVLEQVDHARLALGDGEGVALRGRGVAPRLEITGARLDFGAVEIGDSAQAQALLANALAVPVQVLAIPAPQPPFQRIAGANDCPATPFALAPGESCSLHYRLQPTGNGVHVGRVLIASDEPSTPRRLLLTGVSGDSIFADGFQ